VTLATRAPADVNQLNLGWLVRLRWASVAGQACTILGVHFGMGVSLPLAPLAGIVAFEVLSNLALNRWQRRSPTVRESQLAAVISVDLVLFTGLLYLTGGPTNPFSSLYLIHLALAALVVSPRFTSALVGLTLLCSLGLFFAHMPLAMGGHDHAAMGHYGMHLKGMWVALGVASVFIVYFLDRVKRALRDRDLALELEKERRARQERLAGLAALAAGAAHELASPLATIAVVSKELERALSRASDAVHAEDAKLIRAEVERCSAILSELSAEAGQARAEPPLPMELEELVLASLASHVNDPRLEVRYAEGSRDATLTLRGRLLARALRSVVDNAFDAVTSAGKVVVECERGAGRLHVRVKDDGPGMPPEVRAHALDPFFTTKAPDKGMGLGLFLAVSIVEQLGGELSLHSEPGRGTSVEVEVPA